MAQGDPAKWQMPGWRIEQRFANGVLIGNWGEERLQVHVLVVNVDIVQFVVDIPEIPLNPS